MDHDLIVGFFSILYIRGYEKIPKKLLGLGWLETFHWYLWRVEGNYEGKPPYVNLFCDINYSNGSLKELARNAARNKEVRVRSWSYIWRYLIGSEKWTATDFKRGYVDFVFCV